jgi:16S rRNA (cytosine1402-N4)-methyltransferase
VCVCGRGPRLRIITRRPITASAAEVEENPRARSAKLRVAERISSESETNGNRGSEERKT